jgi:hypothetical protein
VIRAVGVRIPQPARSFKPPVGTNITRRFVRGPPPHFTRTRIDTAGTKVPLATGRDGTFGEIDGHSSLWEEIVGHRLYIADPYCPPHTPVRPHRHAPPRTTMVNEGSWSCSMGPMLREEVFWRCLGRANRGRIGRGRQRPILPGWGVPWRQHIQSLPELFCATEFVEMGVVCGPARPIRGLVRRKCCLICDPESKKPVHSVRYRGIGVLPAHPFLLKCGHRYSFSYVKTDWGRGMRPQRHNLMRCLASFVELERSELEVPDH